MNFQTGPLPGIVYRRPDGDPTRLEVESVGDPGFSVDDLPQTAWLEVVHPEDRGRLRAALAAGDVDVAYRLTVDDKPTWVHEHGRHTEDGDVVGYLLACDSVERRQKLERQRERLEQFARVVSHDLRNPLSVAVGNLELARDLEGDAATERIENAHDALDQMDELISNLLSLAREGRSLEATAETDLRAVVDPAWTTVGSAAGAELVVVDPLPQIECDRDRLQQALENLFRNAIEHGSSADLGSDLDLDGDAHGGEPVDTADPSEVASDVRVFVGRTDDGFYVADNGPGIPETEHESVFEPGHTTVEDGTGFGLAIVDRIARAHGWSVEASESRAGGARFDFAGVELLDDTPPDGPTSADADADDPASGDSAAGDSGRRSVE
ncbi:MAG: histidine kinase domain protein [uncultured archaeon A07HR67]|jgi:Signal transduction histidine kinase|nr:MAG: histidine kinase domain protein [uncultured archaeon A07HR67]